MLNYALRVNLTIAIGKKDKNIFQLI
jgi:hypothetical protein